MYFDGGRGTVPKKAEMRLTNAMDRGKDTCASMTPSPRLTTFTSPFLKGEVIDGRRWMPEYEEVSINVDSTSGASDATFAIRGMRDPTT